MRTRLLFGNLHRSHRHVLAAAMSPEPRADVSTLTPLDDEEDVPEILTSFRIPEGGFPESWKNQNAILCVAGRGPLDAVAAEILLRLLNKNDMNGRTVAYEDVSRDRVGILDVSGTVMACVSYLDIGGAPAHLKYLIERLRQRLPKATPIIIGLWPVDDAAIKDEVLRTDISADYLAVSLSQIITIYERVAFSASPN